LIDFDTVMAAQDSFCDANVRAELPAEAGFVSPVRDDSKTGADRAYNACRSGSA